MKMTKQQVLNYNHIIIAFSGGKDSTAAALNLLDLGVPASRIELWHHDIDGREGSRFMDWACTADYCRQFAQAFGFEIYYSWKIGGFEKEMLRKNTHTAPIKFETPDGIKQIGGTGGKLGTRRLFPQTSASLTTRWCSGYLKVDVCRRAIRNQARFIKKKTLLISGERAEESPNRERYAEFERDDTDTRETRIASKRRQVDRWRPVHKWKESQVWDLIKRFKVRVHPAYYLGFGRCSCAGCIFGNADQWATLAQVDPATVKRIADYEVEFGVTIKRGVTVLQQVDRGTPYQMETAAIDQALNKKYNGPIVIENWTLPAGAFGSGCGPT